MIFFYLKKKKCFLLEISRFQWVFLFVFCCCCCCWFFFVLKSWYFKICDIIIGIATQWKLHLCLFLLNLTTIKMMFHQILMCCMTNKCFYDFVILLKQQYSWILPFLIDPYWPFQKNETLESWHNWLLNNWSWLLNWKGPGT